MSSQDVITIEDDFTLLRFQNDGEEVYYTQREVKSGLIQFHFGLKGKAKFLFNQGSYALDLKEEKSLLLYNPQKELPLIQGNNSIWYCGAWTGFGFHEDGLRSGELVAKDLMESIHPMMQPNSTQDTL